MGLKRSAKDTIQNLLFDWDGTLLDSSEMGFLAFCKTFHDLGMQFNRVIFERIYTPNWYAMYRKLGLPKSRWEDADQLWLDHYGTMTPSLVDGARETLRQLRRQRYRLGLVSSGSRSRVHRELESLQLQAFFDAIVCNEDAPQKKPHPEGLEIAMRSMQVLPRNCTYIGDSAEDVEMGKRALVQTVAVRSNYPKSLQLKDHAPDLYLKSIRELPLYFT